MLVLMVRNKQAITSERSTFDGDVTVKQNGGRHMKHNATEAFFTVIIK